MVSVSPIARLVLYTLIFCFSASLWAQQQGDDTDYYGANSNFEMGFHAGRLLPSQIDGVDEIIPQVGFRTSFRSSEKGFWEVGVQGGNGNGMRWAGAHLGLRLDVPVDTLLAHVILGIDVTRYSSTTVDESTTGGGHIGGGFQALIGGPLWFRTDMKFNISPGVSMYLGFGFVMKYGSEDSAGGAQ